MNGRVISNASLAARWQISLAGVYMPQQADCKDVVEQPLQVLPLRP
jgi:hypothetical protein